MTFRTCTVAALLALATVVSGGCTRATLVVPPVTPIPTNTMHIGKFVWYDLLTDNVEAATAFYGQLFGWQFEASSEAAYTVITHEGTPIAGIADAGATDDSLQTSQWVSWLSVVDVDGAVDAVRQGGGIVHREPSNLPDRGRFAVVSDPQGALVALVRSATGDPADVDAQVGTWLWTELWSGDPVASMAFYEDLVEYEHEQVDGGVPIDYHVFRRDGEARAGVIKNPWEGVRPNWLPYVRVEDPAAIASRAEALGGKVILAPTPELRNSSLAIISDPTGAALTVQRWPPNGS